MRAWGKAARAAAVLAVIVAALGLPASAFAHGPVNPAASSFRARIGQAPAGVRARIVDGDQRLWVQVPPRTTLVVLDYRGAPYVRFDPAGVQVNLSSEMYYLNQVPVQQPPPGLTPRTPPHWRSVSGGHSYQWHDGRLSDLTTTALRPGETYVGRWQVTVRVDGAPATIAGGLYYAPSPSIVWFWPIIVALVCVLAVRRLRRPDLDRRVAHGLALAGLAAFAVAEVCHQLHGRPAVSVTQGVTLAVALAFAVWAGQWVMRGRYGWFSLFVIAGVAIWAGATLIAVLVDGYVLQAGPPFLVRAAVVTSLSCGVALLPIVFAMAEPAVRGRGSSRPGDTADAFEVQDAEAWQADLQ